jgi:hypothetical protein
VKKLLAVLFLMFSTNLFAADASLSYLFGSGYKTGEYTRDTLRVDVSNISDKGLLYARADISSFDNKNSLINTRIIGHYKTGFHPSVQLQNTASVSYTGLGVGYSKFAKEFSYFVDVNYTATSLNVNALQLFGYSKYTLTDKLFLDGFIDHVRFYSGENTTLTQFGINYKLNDFILALEQHVYLNKNRISGLDENLTAVKIKYVF